MADNIDIKDANDVTRTVATDEVGGENYQIVKLAHGADGTATDVTTAAPLPVELVAAESTYSPGYDGPTAALGRINTDPSGQVLVRGPVLTDEGAFRVNFANTSLDVAIPGTPSRTGAVISGLSIGAGFDLHVGDYVKFDADAETAWAEVTKITDDTTIEVAAYSGATSGAMSRALVRPITGTGGSMSVASGQLTINSGTTSGSRTGIVRVVDYAPLVLRARFSLSQRVANQDFVFGLHETELATARWFARFRFTGTTNTAVICETARNPTTTPSAAETQSTAVTIPATSAPNDYRIEQLTESVRFYVNGILVAEHTTTIPSQHDEMIAFASWINTGVPTTSAAVMDYLTAKNHNKLEVGIMSDAEQIAVRAAASPVIAYSVAGVITINTVLVLLDCSQYQGVSIHCHSIGTTGVITPEWSAGGTNWTTATVTTVAGADATTLANTTNYVVARAARFFRLRLSTATTAGTTTVYVQGLAFPVSTRLATQPVSGTVTATVTSTRITPNAADGHSTTQHTISAASTNDTLTKNGAGAIGLITVTNVNAAVRYFKLYNKASAPTSSDTPVMTVLLPPNSTTVIGGNSPIRLATGIGWRLTTGIAVADTGAVAASEHAVSIFYT